MDEIYRKEMCRLYLKNYFKTTLAIQNGFDSLDVYKQLTMAKNVQAKVIIERSIMQNKSLTRFKCRFSLPSRLTSPSSPTSPPLLSEESYSFLLSDAILMLPLSRTLPQLLIEHWFWFMPLTCISLFSSCHLEWILIFLLPDCPLGCKLYGGRE